MTTEKNQPDNDNPTEAELDNFMVDFIQRVSRSFSTFRTMIQLMSGVEMDMVLVARPKIDGEAHGNMIFSNINSREDVKAMLLSASASTETAVNGNMPVRPSDTTAH